LGTAGLSEDGQQMQQLADACLVIDALDPSAKEELIRNVCSKELTAYQQIFQGTGTITCLLPLLDSLLFLSCDESFL